MGPVGGVTLPTGCMHSLASMRREMRHPFRRYGGHTYIAVCAPLATQEAQGVVCGLANSVGPVDGVKVLWGACNR